MELEKRTFLRMVPRKNILKSMDLDGDGVIGAPKRIEKKTLQHSPGDLEVSIVRIGSESLSGLCSHEVATTTASSFCCRYRSRPAARRSRGRFSKVAGCGIRRAVTVRGVSVTCSAGYAKGMLTSGACSRRSASGQKQGRCPSRPVALLQLRAAHALRQKS